MSEQVINYRRSVDPQSQTGRAFISDSLNPWWGTWLNGSGDLTIAYDTLPPDPGVMARLVHPVAAPPASSWVRLDLNNPQNLRNKVLEFWLKGVNTDGYLRLFVAYDVVLSFPTAWDYVYAAGETPTAWTKYQINLESLDEYVPGTRPHTSNRLGLVRPSHLILYWNNLAIGNMNIAGFNIRRL